MFKFLLIFFINLITPVISSTQIACDVMCKTSFTMFNHSLCLIIHYF